MADDTPPEANGGFRITTGVLYTQIGNLQTQVGSLQQQLALMDERMNSALVERGEIKGRLSKLEARLNGVFVGIGTGVLVGGFAVVRGAIG
jgi:hypothetical protein